MLFRLREILQDPFSRVHASWWTTNSCANAQIVFGTHCFGDIAQTVMSTFSPATFEFDGVKRNIDLIVNDDQVINVDSKNLAALATGPPERFINTVGLASTMRGPPTPIWPSTICDREEWRFEFRSHTVGQFIEHHLPNIVSIASVAGPGIPESGYTSQVPSLMMLS